MFGLFKLACLKKHFLVSSLKEYFRIFLEVFFWDDIDIFSASALAVSIIELIDLNVVIIVVRY